ncbi:methyltransferase domain-containing protein [Enterobacter mori]
MKKNLLSHSGEATSATDVSFTLLRQQFRNRIASLPVPEAELLSLFDQLCEFELGRFLIVNKGLNARWTHELIHWTPDDTRPLTALEHVIYAQLPATLATRERYGIFRQELQKRVSPSGVMASVPCGLMHDLLDLTCPVSTRFVGVDLDEEALTGARELAELRGCALQTRLLRADAWRMVFKGTFDVQTSNGLNIYEPDDQKVIGLYKIVFRSLKKGGTFITSFMTPSPLHSHDSCWRMERLEPALLLLQKRLFVDVIDARWSAMRTEHQTRRQLTEAGFGKIRIIYDSAGMFPTVVAEKV